MNPRQIEQLRLTSPTGRLTADFAPALGGEMTSLRLRREGSMTELLHRGGDLQPTPGWSGRAPTLWPVIGRTYLPGPRPTPAEHRVAPLGWEHEGVVYPMPHHGFARSLPWRLDALSDARLRLVLADGPVTRRHYPFGFSLSLGAQVNDDGVRLAYRVLAAADNTAAMPFTLGNHLTFRIPLSGGATLETTKIQCEAARRRLLDAIGCPTGEEVEDRRFLAPTPVTYIKPLDVNVLDGFHDGQARASLVDESGIRVTVSHNVMDEAGVGPLLMTLWGDPPSGYLSLEPWLGLPNALASGVGQVRLAPGEALRWTVEIRVTN